MILQNIECRSAYNISPDWYLGRQPGLSGMVRLRDEEMFCKLALESFVEWCDELVIALNCCTDRTPEIVEEFRARHPTKTKVVRYDFVLHPMGPGHSDCPPDSLHACAYYYNFVQSLTTRTHVVKLDGDMVAHDWLGFTIRSLMKAGHSRIKFSGTDLVHDLKSIGCHPHCPTNGVYKVTAETFYEQGPTTQNIARRLPPPTHTIEKPAFLHFKWCKPIESATVQWPSGWERHEHFHRIYERRLPVAPYEGEYPASVRALLQRPHAA